METNINNSLLIPPIIRINNNVFSMFTNIENNFTNATMTGGNNTGEINNGVSEEFKNNLEEIVADEEFISKEKQCSICLDEFKLGDKYIRLPCQTENEDEKHIFHSGNDTCSGIKPWLERNNTCPMCRTEFPKDENHINPLIETITITVPPINNITNMTNMNIFNDINEGNDADEGIDIENIPNPNDLENRISDIITNYINEIETSNEQRDIQIAIEQSLQINND
uniref:RING-type domain-containing protein n=1 Tax=viral metagenome TaxID=1070528 RepID=A0A6C0FF91_9ZZZZ|tara:strand:+ start:2640 stop:3314 length:675 start_codon:yes stop_codon:yes gene_type:complete